MLCLLPFLDWADQATSQFFLQIIHIFPLEPFFLVNISLIHVIRLARAAMKEKFGSVWHLQGAFRTPTFAAQRQNDRQLFLKARARRGGVTASGGRRAALAVEEEKEQDVGRDGGSDISAQSDLGSLADLYL